MDVYAPGSEIVSQGLSNGTFQGQGTSYATPFVARTAVILRGLYPKRTPEEIKKHIKKFSDQVSTVPDKPLLLNHQNIMAERSNLN